MIALQYPRLAAPSGDCEMEFQLAVLRDACAQADRYWCNWLWHREQPYYSPSGSLLLQWADRDTAAIVGAWKSWFDLLTSWEYADSLIGCDVRELLDEPARR